MQKGTLAKLLITGAIAIGGVGFLVKSSISHAEHYMMVDELYAAGDIKQWDGKTVKIHGFVEDSTDKHGAVGNTQTTAFTLVKNGKKIHIFFRGPTPDTFKPNSEVVAIGRLVKASTMADIAKTLNFDLDPDIEYVLSTDNMMAKCPSKYDGAQVTRQPIKYE